jgi:hydrogenase 3 maturation protease
MPSQKKPSQHQLLKNLKKNLLNATRIAVIGVGSELRGDDVAGVFVAKAIQKSRKRPSNLKAFIGCTAPENITGEVCRYLKKAKGKSAHIILVDAAQMDLKHGHARILEAEGISGTSFSTHVLPLAILISYFEKRSGCGISVIGIQPKDTSFGSEPSEEIRRAVDTVSSIILSAIPKGDGAGCKQRKK